MGRKLWDAAVAVGRLAGALAAVWLVGVPVVLFAGLPLGAAPLVGGLLVALCERN